MADKVVRAYRGRKSGYRFQVSDSAGNLQTITAAVLQIRRSPGDVDVVKEYSTDTGGGLTIAGTGLLDLTIGPTDMDGVFVPLGSKTRDLFYDIKITDGASDPRAVYDGEDEIFTWRVVNTITE